VRGGGEIVLKGEHDSFKNNLGKKEKRYRGRSTGLGTKGGRTLEIRRVSEDKGKKRGRAKTIWYKERKRNRTKEGEGPMESRYSRGEEEGH